MSTAAAVAIAVIGGLFGAGGIAAILKTRSDNKKTDVEAEITLTGGWKLLYETTRTELNEMRERLVVVEKNEQECQRRLSRLEKVSISDLDVEHRVHEMINREIEKRGGEIDESVSARKQ